VRWDRATLGQPLPRSLDPLPDESLPGYLLRLAHRLDRSPHRLATLTGLAGQPAARLLGGHVIHLGQETIDDFAAVTKLTPVEVERLSFADLTGRYAPLNAGYLGRRRRRDRLESTEPWIFGRWSRYCPTCLAGDDSPIQREHGGAWQRLWRLPPVFACTGHRRLLETRCPACAEPAASLHPGLTSMVGCARLQDLHPAQCRNRIPATTTARISTACGAWLDADHEPSTTDAVEPALLAHLLSFQHRILHLLDPTLTAITTSAGEPTTVDRYFTDLRFIANLICLTWPGAQPMAMSAAQAAAIDGHVRQRRHAIRHADRIHSKTQQHAIYDKPPADSLTCGSLLALADHLVNVDDSSTTSRLLSHLIGGNPTANWAAHFLHDQAYCSPGLRAAAEPHIAVYRRRSRTGRPPQPDSRPRLLHRQALLHTAGPFGYTHEHVPAFLPAPWQQQYLPAPNTIAVRHLRRVAAVVLVQYAEQCTIEDAAALLRLPAKPVLTAYKHVSTWARHHPDGAALALSLRTLAAHLGHLPAKVNYGARRLALTDWLIPPDDWQHIVERLQRMSNTTQRQQSDWGERKRNTASALIWTHATQGEHLYAPHRHSPDAQPGSVADRGLAIDRAWWRANQPGLHYAQLKDVCIEIADRVTTVIDK
jgi:hypothetical protein